MALCTLLAKHRETQGWPHSLFAYTIDHGVRRGSAEEAKTVAKLLTSMGIWIPNLSLLISQGFTHSILKLSSAVQAELDKKIPGNLEEVLRAERLGLLENAAKNDSLGAILTGHHQDDQYE